MWHCGSFFENKGPAHQQLCGDGAAETGKVTKVAKPEDLTAVGGRSRISVTVDTEFVHEFARRVKWQKTDKHGNVIDNGEEDATLDPDDPSQPQPSGGDNTGGNTGGGEPSQGGGGNTGGGDDPME